MQERDRQCRLVDPEEIGSVDRVVLSLGVLEVEDGALEAADEAGRIVRVVR